ncbi:PREDICTED: uncharacterized protein LOC109166264 [Ipomoea nil]|uniref:uncharacterized protein LOC109166264 n=1 Tax=Ipomoea nil TaxID=35883 RepID=UPI000901031B|nr:PREDICTED: uncharacterized protein LOC109166264 [Ipomoea nil]
MGSLTWVFPNPHFRPSPPSTHNPLRPQNNLRRVSTAVSCRKPEPSASSNDSTSCSQPLAQKKIISQKSLVPVAMALAALMSSSPANAGFLSGYSGIESVPGPELPQIDFLNRWNEANQKKYAEADARFKESPLLKQLLEKSKLNKEKNRQSIQDKYCIRGAEWGVGDCSTEGMTPEERDNFISALKQKAGVEE